MYIFQLAMCPRLVWNRNHESNLQDLESACIKFGFDPLLGNELHLHNYHFQYVSFSGKHEE